MRVVYLNPFSQEVSGPDESLRNMLRVLIPRGVEAHVVLPAAGPQVDRYRALGAEVHFAPLAPLRRDIAAQALLYPAHLIRAAASVARLARRLSASVIHTNMEILFEGALAARWLRLPHVLHYRGNTLDQPKLVFDGLTAAWTATADAVYCISEATAGVFRRRGRGAKVEVLYNPVDLKSFREPTPGGAAFRARLQVAPGGQLIGLVGRIHPRKDIGTFVRAAALVAAQFPQARFVVVGAAEAPVEHAYRRELDQLVESLGLSQRFIFAGGLRDIPAVMQALDVFVLTSRHEGFGRVVAEAMAAGRPVVVTDEGALPELVAIGDCGRVAAAADPGAFANAILDLLADPAQARRLGERGAQAATQFDADAIGQRVYALYERLIDGRGGAG